MGESGANFSQSYLYNGFNSNYKEGIAALDRGRNVEAKDKLFKAAEFLEKLSIVNPASRDEYLLRAKRIKDIAAAIEIAPPKAQQPAASAGWQGAYGSQSAYGSQGASYGAQAEQEQDDMSDMAQYFSFYTVDKLGGGFDDIIGLESAKAAINEYIILPHKYPEAYSYSFLDGTSILLEGPPGTGKTTFAKAVAKEINQPFALINVASLVNCYVGETGKNIDKVFQYLRDYADRNDTGITIFMDELDEIAKKRGSDDKSSEAAVPALLRNLDGMKGNKNFLIIANTNRKDMLDAAILERFRKQLYIPLPDADMRKRLFEIKLKEVEPSFLIELDMNRAAEISEGLSGRDITFISDDFKYFLSRIKAGIEQDPNIEAKLEQLITERVQNKRQ